MKNQILIMLFLFIGSALYTPLNAQSLKIEEVEKAIKEDGKYALLVGNAQHFKAAVMTGEDLKSKNPKMDFEIVLIGPVVKDLAGDDTLKPFIETSEKFGVRIVVCEFAMKNFEVKKADYHSYIETTPNGFTYIFGLQEHGFKTITL